MKFGFFQRFLARRYAARRRGMTLIETLIYVAVLTMTVVATLRVIGDSRVMRANARDRAIMTLIAHDELERWRATPVSQLTEGTMPAQDNHQPAGDKTWPAGTSATVSLKKMEGESWEIDVRVQREGPEGKPDVRLTTIRPGETP